MNAPTPAPTPAPAPLDDEIIECALCPRKIWFRDSYSPADDAICAECDTEVTGRTHPPSLNPTTDPPPPKEKHQHAH